MLKYAIFFFLTACVFAGKDEDSIYSPRKCTIFPGAVNSDGDLTPEQADQLNQMLRDAGYNTGPAIELTRVTRGTDTVYDRDVEQFQLDLEELGNDEMIRRGRMIYGDTVDISNKVDQVDETTQTTGSEVTEVESKDDQVALEKRGNISYRVAYMDNGRAIWETQPQWDNYCLGRFGRHGDNANYLLWSVSGKSCKFVLYKGIRCKGRQLFNTGGYNVVSDGARFHPHFQSVFWKCR